VLKAFIEEQPDVLKLPSDPRDARDRQNNCHDHPYSDVGADGQEGPSYCLHSCLFGSDTHRITRYQA